MTTETILMFNMKISAISFALALILSGNTFARTAEDIVNEQSDAVLNALEVYHDSGVTGLEKHSTKCYASFKKTSKSPWKCVYFDVASFRITENAPNHYKKHKFFEPLELVKRFGFFLDTAPEEKASKYLTDLREGISSMIDNFQYQNIVRLQSGIEEINNSTEVINEDDMLSIELFEPIKN